MQATPARKAFLRPNPTPGISLPQERVRQLLMVTARYWGVGAAMARPPAPVWAA